MPRIDQLVDVTVGHPRMSFLDAFQGYHQIPLALSEKKKKSIRYFYCKLPLQSGALQFEECGVHLPKDDD